MYEIVGTAEGVGVYDADLNILLLKDRSLLECQQFIKDLQGTAGEVKE